MKKLKEFDAVKILRRCDKKGIGWLHYQGLDFYKDKFVPSIKKLEETKKGIYKELLVSSYYLLGDIHDFNNAPKAAINAYKKGLKYSPNSKSNLDFYKEIGSSYESLGKFDLSIKYFKKALKINPNDKSVKEDLEWTLRYKEENLNPLYGEGNLSWEINELLAKGKGEIALQKLARRRTGKAIKLRTRVYGLVGLYKKQLKEWKKLKYIKGTIELERADIFFNSDSLYDNQEFWKTLFSLRDKFKKSGVIILDDELKKFYGDQNQIKLWHDFLRFKIALCGQNVKKLEKLWMKYPKWRTLEKEIKKLKNIKILK